MTLYKAEVTMFVDIPEHLDWNVELPKCIRDGWFESFTIGTVTVEEEGDET